jgi:very-short-patch-repair endonuclease
MVTNFPPSPFTWPQARGSGITRRQLDEAVEARLLRRALHGVYVDAELEDTPLLRAQAARLVISPHAVLCDRTAAWVLGVDVHAYRELDVLPPIESYVLRGHDPTDRPECGGGTRDLRPCDWIEVDGVRVTTPIRTAMDLGCKLSRRDGLAAIDALMRNYAFTVEDMMRMLPRYFRRRGVRRLRTIVALGSPSSESRAESWVRLELVDHGLPVPVLQHWVRVDGVPTYRLDLAYPHARVAIEYDGEDFHTSPEQRERDRRRRADLRELGWTVIVLTKADLAPERVDVWIRRVREALAGI